MRDDRMNKQIKVLPKGSFYKRSWWGVLCFMLFITICYASCPIKSSSGGSGGVLNTTTFFAYEKPGSVAEIVNPPKKFRILLNSGTLYYFRNRKLVSKEDRLTIKSTPQGIAIESLGVEVLSLDNYKIPLIDSASVTKQGDGSLMYKVYYDTFSTSWDVYSVLDNKITYHYHATSYFFLVPVIALIALILYLLGVIVRQIHRSYKKSPGINFIKNHIGVFIVWSIVSILIFLIIGIETGFL